MQSQRKWSQDRTLHVLVVEADPEALRRTTARLLVEGFDISTARSAAGLYDRVARLEPDLVLMDVLVPELDHRDLSELAARSRAGARPALVVHTKLLKPMLRRVLDVTSLYGFIPKTNDGAQFMQQFQEIAERLASELPTQTFVPRALGSATSGTYARKPGSNHAAAGRRG